MNGLLTRKEQEKLEEKYHTLADTIDDLKVKVNMSSVEAVERALDAKRAAEQKAKNEIEECKRNVTSRIYDIHRERDVAVEKAETAFKSAKSSQQIAWGCLLFTLLCCLVRNQTFIKDIMDFFIIPFTWIISKLDIYINWMKAPYYTQEEKITYFTTGWAWTMRILTALLIMALTFALGAGLCWLFDKYRKRWCNLSLKVLLGILATATVFGDVIRTHIHINLVLIIILTQLLYYGILIYLDGYYEARYRMDEWEKFQNK